jgi:hypothetical protein
MTWNSPKKKLVLSFFFITLTFGLIWAGAHYLLSQFGLAQSVFVYLPFVLLSAILADYRYLRQKIKDVQFKGAGNVTVPTVFYMAVLAITPAFLNGAALFTDRVAEIGTINELAQTHDTFIHVANIQPKIAELIDTVTRETENDEDDGESTRYQYKALVPLARLADDADFSTWVVFSGIETLKGAWPESTILEKQKAFWKIQHDRVLNYPYDSICYFEKEHDEQLLEILKARSRSSTDLIFVRPSLADPSSMRKTAMQFLGWSYLALCIFFIGAVAFGHYEEIIND